MIVQMKRVINIIAACIGMLFLIASLSACGSSTQGAAANAEPDQSGPTSTSSFPAVSPPEGAITTSTVATISPAQELTKRKTAELTGRAFVVEVNMDPPSFSETWSQDGQGNFRMDVDAERSPSLPPGAPTQIICNIAKGKIWYIAGDVAYEDSQHISAAQSAVQGMAGFNFAAGAMPMGLESPLSALKSSYWWGGGVTFTTETDETGRIVAWETHMTIDSTSPPAVYPPAAGGGAIGVPSSAPANGPARTETETNSRVEFYGPEGLPSKMVLDNQGGRTNTLTFEYTQLGEVPESLFELPSSVKEVRDYSELYVMMNRQLAHGGTAQP